MIRLAHFVTHPIQYFAPLYRETARTPGVELTVFFGSRHGTEPSFDREFGREIARIVDGLTKIAKLPSGGSTQERQVESYRKLLLSIAKDARVIIVKLADRLHNMRTLDYLPEEERRRIAQETRDLYAPLSHRFGMAKMRWELEDLAFKHLEADEYRALAKKVAQKRGEREALIKQMREPLQDALEPALHRRLTPSQHRRPFTPAARHIDQLQGMDVVAGSASPGSGSGSQRSRFGSGSTSSKGVPRSAPLPIRRNAGCFADGRIR